MCVFLAGSIPAQERFRRDAPDPDPLPALNLPNIESVVLSNGLGLTVLRVEKAPIMHLRLVFADGESSSPDTLPGLATFAANMLDKGAANLTSSQVDEAIESIGGDFSSTVYPDYSVFSFSFLEDHLDEALDILSKMILQPVFLELEIANVKRTMLYDLLQESEDPEYIAKKIFYRIIFQDHPYKSIAFNDDVIKNFGRDALVAFFDKYYRPNNAKIILIGNINNQTASRKVSHYLNAWQRKEIEKKVVQSPPPYDKMRVCFVQVPRIKSATIVMGSILPPEIKDFFFPLLVFNQVLGGTENSRLLMNLRESNKQYAYWAFSEVEFFRGFGLFYVRAMIRPEAIHPSVTEIIREIQKATQEKLPNDDIEQAKSYLIGHFPLSIKNRDQFAAKVSEKEALNLGDAFWNRYYENISLVNSEDVFKTVHKTDLLAPLVIIVGDMDIVKDSMNEFDEIEIYDKNGSFQSKIIKGVGS